MTPRPLSGTRASAVAHEEDFVSAPLGRRQGRDHRLPSVPSATDGKPHSPASLDTSCPTGEPSEKRCLTCNSQNVSITDECAVRTRSVPGGNAGF